MVKRNSILWMLLAIAFVLGLLGAFSRAADVMKPMPEPTIDDANQTGRGILGCGPESPGDPGLSEGLQKIDSPKFFFGAGLLVTLVGATIKLALIVATVFVAVHFTKHRRGTKTEPKKDAVDSLLAAFEDLKNIMEAERAKHQVEASKLDASLNKLSKGAPDVVQK